MIIEIIIPGFDPILIDSNVEIAKMKAAAAGDAPQKNNPGKIIKYYMLDPATKSVFEMEEDPKDFAGKEQRVLKVCASLGKCPIVTTALIPGLAR